MHVRRHEVLCSQNLLHFFILLCFHTALLLSLTECMHEGTKEEMEIIARYTEYEITQKLRGGETVSETELKCLCQTKVPHSDKSFHSELRPHLLQFGEYPIISLLTNAVNIELLLEQLSHEDTSEVCR